MRVDDGSSDDPRPENPSVPEDNNGNSGEISKFAHKYVALVRDRDHKDQIIIASQTERERAINVCML